MLNTSFKSTPNTSPPPLLVYFMSTVSREQTKTNFKPPKDNKNQEKYISIVYTCNTDVQIRDGIWCLSQLFFWPLEHGNRAKAILPSSQTTKIIIDTKMFDNLAQKFKKTYFNWVSSFQKSPQLIALRKNGSLKFALQKGGKRQETIQIPPMVPNHFSLFPFGVPSKYTAVLSLLGLVPPFLLFAHEEDLPRYTHIT